MVEPQFLLDALNESIASGTFIDTKFHVFSHRGASGRVTSPRSLYCSGHVLNTVPYFSTLFSDGFLEGQTRNIDEEFPSDSFPYIDYYDYLSDSDLEDEEEGEEPAEDGKPELPLGTQDLHSETSPAANPPRPSRDMCDSVESHHTHENGSVRMGRVAIIRDMAAVTFEAMMYYLYTGEVIFAPFSSDPRHELHAGARSGDWNAAKPPSPSAKSIYRLADKYDIPTLKERAKTFIHENLEYCDIVDEVFSSFSLSFPEILSVQASRLVSKMKEESTKGTESDTRRQLRDKIASLSPLELGRATDALVMIWNGVIGPLDLPPPKPQSTFSPKLTPSPNWHRVQLALLKSIPTGTFIDVQFYAYSAIHDGLPRDLKPLFTSSIVIEEWAAAITTQTAGADSQAACLTDGLTDDYECWYGKLPETSLKDKIVIKYRTEAAATTGSREVVVLMSGAWRTWTSLLSCAYTNEMTFAPLQDSTRDGDPAADAKMQRHQSCSPRSMYSLAASLGIENIKEHALKDIKSKLSPSNIAQELFTSFAASHTVVMDIEIEFLHSNFTEKNPKLLMEHIQRMAYGGAPFLSTTLSLVYDKLVEKVFVQPVASGFGLRDPPGSERTINPASHVNPPPASTPTVTLPSSSQTAPTPRPSGTAAQVAWLECTRCGTYSILENVYEDMRCPICPERSAKKGRPRMKCQLCNVTPVVYRVDCANSKCRVKFV
ncbi:hypothetical protein BJ322DRAFT_343003 [Thelephora terrestris]|uniref:BTB domain-containing protein n=1 Tax=Thelephora terrestris TaxID=56493 RepID=A0A9P6H5E8_9AGAM|nr:hypothetical protein BJ322DRAFT_343003 [Thelephora terrestris]